MTAYCAFGIACVNHKCGYIHWQRIDKGDEDVHMRMKFALLRKKVIEMDPLRLIPTSDTKERCCRFSLLCFERECPYRHPFNINKDFEVNYRINLKNIIQKFLKAWNKVENKNLTHAEFETWLDEWFKQLIQATLKKEIEEYRDGKQVDWNDLDDQP